MGCVVRAEAGEEVGAKVISWPIAGCGGPAAAPAMGSHDFARLASGPALSTFRDALGEDDCALGFNNAAGSHDMLDMLDMLPCGVAAALSKSKSWPLEGVSKKDSSPRSEI